MSVGTNRTAGDSRCGWRRTKEPRLQDVETRPPRGEGENCSPVTIPKYPSARGEPMDGMAAMYTNCDASLYIEQTARSEE